MKRWVIYGMVHIDTEVHQIDKQFIEKRKEAIKKYNSTHKEQLDYDLPEGFEKYSEIVENGETRPTLYIPRDTSFGWKRLTAIYSDDFKEIYIGTVKRTLLYYGAKVWVSCPCVFYTVGDKTVTLKAVLISHNRLIPAGTGAFSYNSEPINNLKYDVVNGKCEQKFIVPTYVNPVNNTKYSFNFDVNFKYELTPDFGSGILYVNSVPKGKTRLNVDVSTIIMNQNETQKLVARVYHHVYEDYIKYIEDIPKGGYIEFYVNGKYIGKGNVNEGGFASVNYTAQLHMGVYTITATYVPDTEELQTKYVSTTACGTLYAGNAINKPQITLQSLLCTYLNNDNVNFKIKSDKDLNGTLSLYIDGEKITLKDSDSNKEFPVENTKNVTLSFDTLGSITNKNYRWNYSGYHNLILKYSVDDGLGYPLEYYYYLNYYYIQRQVEIELDGEPDNYTVKNGNANVYVGNNLFYDNDGTPTWYTPANNRPRSTTIGNKVKIKVSDAFNPKDIVNEGYVKLTFVTRTNNNDMEDNIG